MSRFLRRTCPAIPSATSIINCGHDAVCARHNPSTGHPHRPDYVVSRDGTVVAMLDAKYRDIWEKGLPREMLYQLAICALSQRAGGKATILYPPSRRAARPEVIDIRDVLYGERRPRSC